MQNMMNRINFTPEEQDFFLKLHQSLSADILSQMDAMKQEYLNPGENRRIVNSRIKEKLAQMAELVGTHPFSFQMLFLLLCAPELPKGYVRRGWDEKHAYNLLLDLRYKLTECEKCHGIIGVQSFDWFHAHFLFTRLGIGYFQYDPLLWELDIDYHFGDIHITKGDPVYKIHIPSSGKMTRETRLASYCALHDFLGYKRGEPIVLFCRTWLLYEKYREVYPTGSNLLDFMDDFDLFWNKECDTFDDAWRIFYQPYNGDTSLLPRDTTLQRNFIEYINNGGKFGSGAGVVICDGERILNNKRDNT